METTNSNDWKLNGFILSIARNENQRLLAQDLSPSREGACAANNNAISCNDHSYELLFRHSSDVPHILCVFQLPDARQVDHAR